MSVKENLHIIKNNLPINCTLVAVSKTKPNELIIEAYQSGQRDFGENYVQELCAKQEVLPKDINWHFIGHLQSNKVKYIIPFVCLIHGVDSKKLLIEIDKQAKKADRKVKVLLQYYIAKEETKFGLDDKELDEIVTLVQKKELPNVLISGLMGMASNTENDAIIEQEYKLINTKFIELKSELGADFTILSTGMSSDYKIALNNGSTMVRVGSSIFGTRNYSK